MPSVLPEAIKPFSILNMRKVILTLFVATAISSMAQSSMELTATEVATRMSPGWNLGNTLEAGDSRNNFTNNGGLSAETAWQGTKTTQAVIDFVKAQGFRSIRIPCAWVMGHIIDASDYTIDPVWMNRVKEIVDYSLKAGLYVVINQHWDGGWLENNIKDATLIPKNKFILNKIWQQIAETFRDYDERLLFAGLNEPNADTQSATNNLVEYEQEFINTVRASGGKNALRVLIIQGPGTNIDHTCNFLTKLPTDPAAQRMMVEVHYYAPWQFWGMEKDESWGKVFYYWGKDNHVSGSQHNATHSEEEYMEEELEKMKTMFADKGIPVYIGEFGANWRTISGSGESQEKHNASIKHHYKTLMKKCFAKGLIPVVWDTNYLNRPSMTIINRQALSIYNNYMMSGIHEAMEESGIPVTAVQAVHTNQSAGSGVYNLQGQYVCSTLLSSLPSGFYIHNGTKYVVK